MSTAADNKIRMLLAEVCVTLMAEAMCYSDPDAAGNVKYDPHGRALLKLADRCRKAAEQLREG